mmetsp:Transcript_21186/g.60492  ORF Transcript_21186/g.60492 Transcript_21186/m.60492 type:complete len:362 (-) Transcript_21186:236-1321(-)
MVYGSYFGQNFVTCRQEGFVIRFCVVLRLVRHDFVVHLGFFIFNRFKAHQGATQIAIVATSTATSVLSGRVTHFTVQHLEFVVIDLARQQVVARAIGVIQAITQISVREDLVRVRQAKAVADLVAHGVLPRLRRRVEEVVLVHLGHGGLDDALPVQRHLVDAQPSGVAVVAVAHLHDAPDLRAHLVDLDLLGGQREGVRVAVVPVANRLLELVDPRVLQRVLQLQRQPADALRGLPPRTRGVVADEGIDVPLIHEGGQVAEHVGVVAEVEVADGLLDVGLAQPPPHSVGAGAQDAEREAQSAEAAQTGRFLCHRCAWYCCVYAIDMGGLLISLTEEAAKMRMCRMEGSFSRLRCRWRSVDK